MGDGMMMKNVRILVATAALVLLGAGVPLLAEESIPAIQGMGAEAGPSGPVLHLRATGEMETVHYSPQPGVWVVELPEARWEDGVGRLTDTGTGIERAELDHVEEFGKRVSRLTVWLAEPAQLNLTASAGGLDLEFYSFTDQPLEPARVTREDVALDEPSTPASVAPQALSGPANLYEVVPVRTGDGVVVELKADRVLKVSSFTLPEPRRLVLDLSGVVNHVDRHLMPVNAPLVSQVRVAQFQAAPEPITRVVIDLRSEAEYQVDGTATGAVVSVGVDRQAVAAAAGSNSRESVRIAEAGTIEITRSQPKTEPEPAQAVVSAMFDVPEEPARSDAATDRAVESERSPWVADQDQLIEQATAAKVLESPTRAGESYAATEVENQQEQWTGEPITLTLKDADVKDVLKTFSVLTELNIVLDPGVSGSVTVELRDVPWDQALDLILKINGLDYVLENNVLRVAPINKLAAEKSAKAAFDKERERAKPLSTYLKPLSYAKADYVAGLLTTDSYLLSERGSVTVDERTNTLIIRDVNDRVEGILRLIDSLDLPTPQVVIEGRIVETTKQFSRELGVSWGFTGIMDAEHGNDTGLNFPNSIGAVGSVDLPAGQTVLAMTFGDILNTFNLDFQLTAAESSGTARVVSTPRVTTQNLKRASIRSGLQIPVQTVANNTVTVQYVDATLRLEVTPQITAEGTVNLDISIKKQRPAPEFAVAGGQNAPIFTRDAETQLLIRDGGTTVIGGIYEITDGQGEDRIPGLHKIPIFGWLFKNKSVRLDHDELLIFITPRIVKY